MDEPKASSVSPDWMARGELLPWSWARERIEREINYWVCSVQRSGRPRARPCWGLFMDDTLYLTVGHAGLPNAVRRDDGGIEATIHLDSAMEVVILEGVVERFEDPETRQRRLELYNRKYRWDMSDDMNFRLRPRVAYGWWYEHWRADPHGTKWTFDRGASP